jgi:hypothetical protein
MSELLIKLAKQSFIIILKLFDSCAFNNKNKNEGWIQYKLEKDLPTFSQYLIQGMTRISVRAAQKHQWVATTFTEQSDKDKQGGIQYLILSTPGGDEESNKGGRNHLAFLYLSRME